MDRAVPQVHAARWRHAAYTLIEVMILVIIIGALAAIAVPSFQKYRERVMVVQAMADITHIATAIQQYYLDNRSYPPSLSAIGISFLDPWGTPYQYLPIAVIPPPHVGKTRKDKNLHPLNSDFDLYSMGTDRMTQMQITGAKGKDDIVRAGNGRFIGLAADH